MKDELLIKYIAGEVSAKEAEEVTDWLNADPKHVDEFLALHKVYDISIMNPVDGAAIKPSGQSIWLRYRRVVTELLKVAAIFLVAFGIYQLLDRPTAEKVASQPLYQTLYVPAGQRAELILPDSTHVWLNAHSKLVYPVSFLTENRTVRLEGEGYFEVKRNEQSPFVVQTSQMDIKVLGTEFNVSAYPESPDFGVALLKGKVELNAANKKISYTMKPNELFQYKEGKYTASTITEMDYFKWKEGLICFHNQTIAEIMDKLSLYFDIKIEIRNRKFLNERYTGKFRTKDGVEQVLKVLQLEHKFTYQKDNELNKITIK